jgi:hypothetical protein
MSEPYEAGALSTHMRERTPNIDRSSPLLCPTRAADAGVFGVGSGTSLAENDPIEASAIPRRTSIGSGGGEFEWCELPHNGPAADPG